MACWFLNSHWKTFSCSVQLILLSGFQMRSPRLENKSYRIILSQFRSRTPLLSSVETWVINWISLWWIINCWNGLEWWWLGGAGLQWWLRGVGLVVGWFFSSFFFFFIFLLLMGCCGRWERERVWPVRDKKIINYYYIKLQ